MQQKELIIGEMDEETTQQALELMEVECKSESTIKQYQRHIKGFTDFYGERPKQKCIIKYLHYLRKKRKYDKSSMNVARSALLYYYRVVLEQQILIKIPSQKRRKSIPKPLPKNIIKKIIENTKNPKHRLLFELTYDGGFRPEEAVSLQWEDVDWENQSIMINRGKGDKDRPSYLSETVMRHLRDYKEIQEKENPNCIYIFDSKQRPNYHICKGTFAKKMKKVAKRLGIEMRVYPYALRHSFATHLKESGEPIEDIQPRMGHSNIKTTLGYAKVAKPREDMKSPMDDPYFNQIAVSRSA